MQDSIESRQQLLLELFLGEVQYQHINFEVE